MAKRKDRSKKRGLERKRRIRIEEEGFAWFSFKAEARVPQEFVIFFFFFFISDFATLEL